MKFDLLNAQWQWTGREPSEAQVFYFCYKTTIVSQKIFFFLEFKVRYTNVLLSTLQPS